MVTASLCFRRSFDTSRQLKLLSYWLWRGSSSPTFYNSIAELSDHLWTMIGFPRCLLIKLNVSWGLSLRHIKYQNLAVSRRQSRNFRSKEINCMASFSFFEQKRAISTMRPLGSQLPLHCFFLRLRSCLARIDGIICKPGYRGRLIGAAFAFSLGA